MGYGEWWLFGAVAAASVGVSLTQPIDRYYGEARSHLSRGMIVVDHLLALALLVLFIRLLPRMSDSSVVEWLLWTFLVISVAVFFARSLVAWRRMTRRPRAA